MSLYNAVFGANPDADKLLEVLGKTKADFGRFRDVFIEDDCIVVHTRNGGGNRDDYQDVFEEMSNHPWYVQDADDDFDCTYANIYFRIPLDESSNVEINSLNAGQVPAKKWEALFKSLG